MCYTIRYAAPGGQTDRNPLAIFGVADDPNTAAWGVVWMLATPRIQKVWLALMKVSPKWLDLLAAPYTAGLHNIVDARNTLHVRWLQKTGFKPRQTIIHNGHKFIHAARSNR